jgi:hypothetical protein
MDELGRLSAAFPIAASRSRAAREWPVQTPRVTADARWRWPPAVLSCHQDDESTEEINMHAVVRTYTGTGARQLFDVLEANKADVQSNLQKVSGMVSYTLLRQGDGGISVTVCADKAGTDESLRVVREWIRNNASSIDASPPTVTEGTVIVQIT